LIDDAPETGLKSSARRIAISILQLPILTGGPIMNVKCLAFACFILMLAGPAGAVVTQQAYRIDAGGSYQYKPGPEGPGIPGGMPSDFQLDFGIGGTFVYELDTSGPTARLLNLSLVLTGNEAIQAAPPIVLPVTADRVGTYLASQVFVEDFIGGLLHLESATVPGLKLTDGLNGNLMIVGGYDDTPADGDGLNFQFSARSIPEPSTCALAVFAVLAASSPARRRIG
jgi:hypothetical protein